MMNLLSKAEKQFLEALKKGDLSAYSANYKRQLKFVLLKKIERTKADLEIIEPLLEKLKAV